MSVIPQKKKKKKNLHFSGEVSILLVEFLVCSRTQLLWGILRGAKHMALGLGAGELELLVTFEVGTIILMCLCLSVRLCRIRITHRVSCDDSIQKHCLITLPIYFVYSHLKWSCPRSATFSEVFHFCPGVCITC